MVYRDLSIFSGTAHPELAHAVCGYLGVPLGKAEVVKFSNENIFPKISQNVREHDVFVIQPTFPDVSDSILELLIMMDALKRASASRITAVVPYFSYARSDKKDQPRVPITARLIADMVGASVAFVEKRRLGNNSSSEQLGVIGDVRGKSAIIIDDEIDTAGSIVGAAEIVKREGARSVFAACTHALLTGPAIDRLSRSPIEELIVTDTVVQPLRKRLPNMTILSVSLLLGEAISRIHTGESVGAMFGAPV